MTRQSPDAPSLRELILEDPDRVVADRDVITALVAATEGGLGANVVDLRGALLERLQLRLGALEKAHRGVISAAYDNVSATRQIHRVALSLLDCARLAEVMRTVHDEVPELLSVDIARLALEVDEGGRPKGLRGAVALPQGQIAAYLGAEGDAARRVTLRPVPAEGAAHFYGADAAWVRSEAAIRLELGAAGRPALLLLGAADEARFDRSQGTDLLAFLGAVTEQTVSRLLP
ncbi:MAG: DUF484 family protein [Pseudomonadota bacterium]